MRGVGRFADEIPSVDKCRQWRSSRIVYEPGGQHVVLWSSHSSPRTSLRSISLYFHKDISTDNVGFERKRRTGPKCVHDSSQLLDGYFGILTNSVRSRPPPMSVGSACACTSIDFLPLLDASSSSTSSSASTRYIRRPPHIPSSASCRNEPNAGLGPRGSGAHDSW